MIHYTILKAILLTLHSFINSNKVYDITPEMLSELDNYEEIVSAENEELVDLREKNVWGGQYSVLYAHGDFKINGKLYKNYIAEVLAGRYLIRFEENPMYINPFILCAIEVFANPWNNKVLAKLYKEFCNITYKLFKS